MVNTLITRISKLEQYDSANKNILWEDITESRWTNVYGLLTINDNAIFIGNDKLYIGAVEELNNGKSILFSNIQELSLANDQFLQLNEIYPELISRVKANFQPFIHPKEIDLVELVDAIKNKWFVNFYIIKGLAKFDEFKHNLKEYDRVILVNENGKIENVKIFLNEDLKNFPSELNIKLSVEDLTLNEVLSINKSIIRKSIKSNNVTRIENITKTLEEKGQYKFTTFFSYYDALFNKTVYSDVVKKNTITEITLAKDENIYKVSMSPKDIDETAFNHFSENNIIIVHGKTKAKGISYQTQGDTFSKQMKVGDYFYICRGNLNMELVGRITSESMPCEYADYVDEGWLQRTYENVADSISTNSYQDEKKWWTPNDNSTCIQIPESNIEDANKLLFKPFFKLKFIQENIDDPLTITSDMEEKEPSLNQILFGPPGTGKTYNSIDLAVNIANGNSSLLHSENKIQFDILRKAGQIEFITFHQNYSYEDFMVGIKPDVTESSFLKFETHYGIFYKLCKAAEENYLKSLSETQNETYISFEDVWNEFLKDVPATKPVFGSTTKYFVYDYDDSRLYFETIDGKKEKWQRILKDKLKGYFNDSFKYEGGYDAYYQQLNEKLSLIKTTLQGKAKEKLVERVNYVLVIDEINRANISKVFGELITLLEDDKRLGKDNELKITLPNGEKEFGIPPNLFVIGTMNTADKSIALIDIALRRRFEFVGKYPEYKDLNLKEKELLKKINANIYEKKKSADYLIGHAYFMKKQSIETVLKNKVIPLLMEYFSSKTDIVSSIFEGSGWVVSYDSTMYYWNITER
ncbi:MAG: AAA family ATPase [Bacteroidetes bacterium]|nr:AAA family ATPase [Bacteroidota bacterium]